MYLLQVGSVNAFDNDINHKNLIYTLVHGETGDELDMVQNVFSLDIRSGQFTLLKRLDYETDPSQYVFYVEANDGKYKSLPVKVVFNLINLPDNSPTFEQSSYKIDLMENVIVRNVLCVQATDLDAISIIQRTEHNMINTIDHDGIVNESVSMFNVTIPEQFPLKYYIDPHHHHYHGLIDKSIREHFSIDITNGCLSVIKALDRETLPMIEFIVNAYDGYSNASTNVEVKVLDDNDNYPVFEVMTPTIIYIEENVPLDTIVYQFKATDMDEPPNSYIQYEIVQPQQQQVSKTNDSTLRLQQTGGFIPFAIGSIDGQLKVTGTIDREMIDHYDLIIRANDYGLKSSEFACRIKVIDVIDNSPTFERRFIEISLYENVTVGESVWKLYAQDLDQTDELNYKINFISANSKGDGSIRFTTQPFRIDDDELLVATKLNYEEINVYNLKINAIDKAGNFDTLHLRINVLDVIDERPIFLDSPFHVNWFENHIGVLDRYEAVPEDVFEDDIANVQSFHGHINYLLMNNYENSFRLNSTSGTLSVTKPIDRELLVTQHSVADGTIELKLMAIDTRSRLSSEGSVFVHIIDSNDNEPTFEYESYTFNLIENQWYDKNSTIGIVRATDADNNDSDDNRLVYKLLEHVGNVEQFAIDSYNGRIYIKEAIEFDREQEATYHLIVKVTDSKHEIQMNVTVNIEDVNDSIPRIIQLNNQNYQLQNTTEKRLLLKMSHTQLNAIVEKRFPLIGIQIDDQDEGSNGQVQFRFGPSSLDHHESIINLDQTNGLIRCDEQHKSIGQLKEMFGTSMKSTSTPIEIIVEDNAAAEMGRRFSQTYFIDFSIDVLGNNINNNDIRERRLMMDQFVELNISELSPLNVVLHRFEPLTIENVPELEIYAGDVYGQFAIQNYQLMLVKQLDYERTKSFNLYLQATNRQQQQSKNFDEFQLIHLKVNVQNENDNPPKFEHMIYNATIVEEEEEPMFVLKMVAIDIDDDDDDDDDDQVEYQILNKEPIPFRIDAHSGDVWTTERIDRETNSSFRLVISAKDDGGLFSTCVVMVTIEDKNDNPPRFTRLYRVNITENTPIGSPVIQVTSIDRDEGGLSLPFSPSNVTYQLLTKTEAFTMDRLTGQVYVNGHLDREQIDQYLLTISADDGSWKAQTTLAIYILDENDVVPQFEMNSYQFDYDCDGQMNATIGKVHAFDCDEGANQLITYRLKYRSKYFTIDSHSGMLIMKRRPTMYDNIELNYLNQHFLTIIASDNGLLPQSAEVSVLVRCFNGTTIPNEMISIMIPIDLANHTVLYTFNSLINLTNEQHQNQNQQIFATKYNQLLFMGQNNVKLNQNYMMRLDISYIGQVNVSILIIEANRFAPQFVALDKKNHTLSLSEAIVPIVETSSSSSYLIEQFSAIDQDLNKANNEIKYRLNLTSIQWNVNSSLYLSSNYRDKYAHLFKKNLSVPELVLNIRELTGVLNPFMINQTNGNLNLIHQLDYELIVRYSLLISASDNAWYSKESTIEFDLLVNNIEDFVDYCKLIIINQTNQ